MSSLIPRPEVPGASLNYDIPVSSPIINRSTTKIPPSNGQSFNANGKIIIDIPASGYMDSANTYLTFFSSIQAIGGGTLPQFQQGGVPWLRRLRISSGRNETIEDIQDYNKLEHMMVKLSAHPDYVNSNGEILASYGDNTAFAANSGNHSDVLRANAGGKQHNVHYSLSGLFANAKYWPLLVTDGLRIEMFLDSASNCIINTGGGTNEYTIKFVSMVTEIVDVADSYMNAFLSRLNSPDGIKMHVPTYLSTQTNVSSTQENVKITEAVRSIKSVFSTLRRTSELSGPTQNGFQTRQYQLEEAQWRFGNKYYPNQEIKCGGNATGPGNATDTEGAGGAEALSEVLKALNKAHGVDEGNLLQHSDDGVDSRSGSQWSSSKANGGGGAEGDSEAFVIGVNLELDPDNRLSGLDGNRRILDLKLKFATGFPANPLTLQSYVYYDQVVLIDPTSLHVVF